MIPYSQIREECELFEYREIAFGYEEVYIHNERNIIFTCLFSKILEYSVPMTIFYKYINE